MTGKTHFTTIGGELYALQIKVYINDWLRSTNKCQLVGYKNY